VRRRALALAVLAAWPAVAFAGDSALQKAIDRIVDRPAFAPALWGIEVRSLPSGQVLYARNAGKNLKPASTFKLVATAAALDAFGPEARLRTTLTTAARLDGLGRLLGDLYLVGGGDPNLSGRFSEGRITAGFEALADQLAAAGVKRIEGRLLGHEGLFMGERRGDNWTWDDLVWCYGAEASALSFNDNCVDLTVSPGERVGDPVVVDAMPTSSYYRLLSTATTSAAGAKQDLVLARDAGSNLIRLSGALALGATPEELEVAVEDPARYAATVFAEVLGARGIRVAGGVATTSDPLPAEARVLASLDSKPMADLVRVVNKESQNLHTEILLRLLGARVKGEGSVEAGHAAVREFLKRQGLASEWGAWQDASGLSRSDLVVPHELAGLLAAMDRHPHAQAFRDSLPIAGVDGSLKNRLKDTVAQGRVQAKTGAIRHVRGLAGYATTLKGQRLAFVALVNGDVLSGSEAATALDEIAVALVRR
jgi:D-alanyl-D-alanine carboxypeptidase/D-alanyl-D-alanine-endopeptidase (penicillin-binding protein 4)